MLAYVDILSPISLAECIIMFMSVFVLMFRFLGLFICRPYSHYPVSTFLRSCDCLRPQIVIYHVLYSTLIRNYNPSTVPKGLCLSLTINKLKATYDHTAGQVTCLRLPIA